METKNSQIWQKSDQKQPKFIWKDESSDDKDRREESSALKINIRKAGGRFFID